MLSRRQVCACHHGFGEAVILRQNRSERIRRGRERRKRNALAAIDDQPQGGAGDLAERLACDEPRQRAEEHTYELKSLMHISYAVVCLKKNMNNHNTNK